MSRVLVVDDDLGMQRLLDQTLRGDGHEVLQATDGATGLHRALHEAPDVVILDLGLPKLDGQTVLKVLHAEQPHCQVLVLSGDDRLDSRVECLESGAGDYMHKPFQLRELKARLHARLREATTGAASTSLHAGSLKLDLSRMRVTQDGRVVPVSAKEFALLAYLLRRIGAVCTREELMREIWGYDFDAASNVVEVYVSRLRQKIGTEAIETVRNVGYAFVA